MDLGLKGRIAWLAGSSKGIGLAVARELAAEGASLALGARSEDGLAAAADLIEADCGRRPFTAPLDMTDETSVTDWAAACRAGLGDAELLFSNAGGPQPGDHATLDAADWRAAADLILHPAVALSREVLPAMKTVGWGRILFLTSVSVRQPILGLMLSNSLRAAVQGYARTLASEVAAGGITVNCIGPGYTRTERVVELAAKLAATKGVDPAEIEAGWLADIPMGRLGRPEEIAAAAAFLLGERASYVTGQMLTVDGGYARSLL